MLNKVMLIGNLGRDPEIRHTAGGSQVANLNIATTHKRKENDQWVDQTEWHRLVAFGRLAEVCGQYLRKGSKIYVEGRLQTRSWEDQAGVKKYSTEVIVNEMKMLTSKAESSQTDQATEVYRPHTPQAQQAQQVAAYLNQPPPPTDDDMPF